MGTKFITQSKKAINFQGQSVLLQLRLEKSDFLEEEVLCRL